MRVCVMTDWVGPDCEYSLVSYDGRVARGFKSEADAVEYAIKQGWQVI